MILPTLALAQADLSVAIRTFRQAIENAPTEDAVWTLRRLVWTYEDDLDQLDAACRERMRTLDRNLCGPFEKETR